MNSYLRPPQMGAESTTSMPINLTALVTAILAVIILREAGDDLATLDATFILLLAFAVPVILLEFFFLKTHRRPSTGLDFSLNPPWDLARTGVKLIGFYSTLAACAFVYWLFPEYHSTFYNSFWEMLRKALPILLILSMPYFVLIDHYMVAPMDGFWNLGMLVLGQWSSVDRNTLGQHLLGWLVKAYFLPLMFVYFFQEVEYIQLIDLYDVMSSFQGFYDFVYRMIFAVDLLLVTVGYTLTLRLFDSHIRSVEPTLLGWCVALECYQPFWSFSSSTYLKYHHNIAWGDWLAGHQVMYVVWGSTILLLLGIYVYATIPFGIRFSNLTNRGIITNGPYRFTKHPAYVSKNISWWLISIPFISNTSVFEALRLSLLLLCVNIIYFLRARTEERHLSKDPAYVQYATFMNDKSMFSWLGRLLPPLQYRPFRLFNIR